MRDKCAELSQPPTEEDGDYDVPTQQEIEATNYPAFMEDKSFKEVVYKFSTELAGTMDSGIGGMWVINPINLNYCILKAAFEIGNGAEAALITFFKCVGLEGVITFLSLMKGILQGGWNWAVDIFKIIPDIFNALTNPTNGELMMKIWTMLTNVQMWQQFQTFINKALKDPDFYMILFLSVGVSALGSAGVPSASDLLNSTLVSLATYGIYENKEQLLPIIQNMLIQQMEEILAKDQYQQAEWIGSLIGYIAPDVVLTLFSGGISSAIRSVMKLSPAIKAVAVSVDKFADFVSGIARLASNASNKLARYINETIQIAGQSVKVLKFADQRIGFGGGDVIKYIDNLDDYKVDDLIKTFAKESDKDGIARFAWGAKVCKNSTTSACTVLLNRWDDIDIGKPKIYKKDGSPFYPDSWWRNGGKKLAEKVSSGEDVKVDSLEAAKTLFERGGFQSKHQHLIENPHKGNLQVPPLHRDYPHINTTKGTIIITEK